MMNKYEIRERIKGFKTILNQMEKITAADSVFKRLEESAAFQLAEKVLMYHSLPDELDTRRFLNKWKGKKKFFLPRVNGVNLELLPYDESRLEIGSFHIEEPSGDETYPVEEIEMVVVPGIAFDRKGNRLGRGKGFYDRLLRNVRVYKVGVAYDFQLVEDLPTDPHDVPMDMIITEKTTIFVK